MVKRIVSFALHQPLFVIAAAGLLFIGGGVAAFRSLPVEAFPDVTDIQVTVITLFPGHAPEEVEKQVTIPLEIGLSGLPNAVRMFSHTQFGLSFLIAHVRRQGQRLLRAPAGARAAAAASTCRQGVQPQLAPLSTPIGEIYRYRLHGDGPRPHRAAQHRRTGSSSAQLKHGARRRRRRQPRRLHQAVPGQPRPARTEVATTSRCSRFHGARPRQRQRRRQLPRAGRAAVPDPRHRPAALARTTSATSSSPSTAARRC